MHRIMYYLLSQIMATGHFPEVSPGTPFVSEIPSLNLFFSVFADDLVDYVKNSLKIYQKSTKTNKEI